MTRYGVSVIGRGLALVAVKALLWCAPASAQEMSWTIHTLTAKEVELSGNIGKGIAAQFADVLKANPGLRIVHVNLGRGGFVKEAIALSDVIYRHRLDTYVPRACGPACSIVVSGGLRRYVHIGIPLGYANYSSDQGQLTAAQWQALYKTRFSADFIKRAIEAQPKKPWVPTEQELLSGGAVTGIVNGAGFAKSSITFKAADIERELLSKRVFQVIRKLEPEKFTALVGSLENSVAGGMAVERITPAAAGWIEYYGKRYMVYADDQAIHAYIKAQLAEAEFLAANDAASCYAFMGGLDKTARERAKAMVPAELRTGTFDLLADVLESADPKRPPPDMARAKSLDQQVIAAMGADGPLLKQSTGPETPPEVGCRVFLGYYKGIAALPAQDAATIFKSDLLR
jgi:hypothetical protein